MNFYIYFFAATPIGAHCCDATCQVFGFVLLVLAVWGVFNVYLKYIIYMYILCYIYIYILYIFCTLEHTKAPGAKGDNLKCIIYIYIYIYVYIMLYIYIYINIIHILHPGAH